MKNKTKSGADSQTNYGLMDTKGRKGALPDLKKHWIFGKRSFHLWTGSRHINPLVNMVMARGGLLPLLAIHFLFQKDMYGNEIINHIKSKTNMAWSPKPGTIYPLLKELEEEKLVIGYWDTGQKRARKIYSLTARGKKEYRLLKPLFEPQLKQSIEIFNKLYIDLFSTEEGREKKYEK